MLEARKENKVYQINEQQKDRYLKDGFDIYEDGNLLEHTPKKKITLAEHERILNEAILAKDNEILTLKNQIENSKEGTEHENVLEMLKKYANSKSIDIGSSSSANGILAKIIEVEKE